MDEGNTAVLENPAPNTEVDPKTRLVELLREPRTDVQVKHVFGTAYRVNWFRMSSTGLGFSTPKLCKSAFLYFDGEDIAYARQQ